MDSRNFSVLFIGLLLLLFGLLIRYLIGKRRFKRRTIGGMQVFKSYNKSLLVPIVEGLLIIISFLMILSGASITLLYYFNYR